MSEAEAPAANVVPLAETPDTPASARTAPAPAPPAARKLFGTDGVRGTANTEPMTAETALRLGMAAGRHFSIPGRRSRVVIGKDTRRSGYMLESAMTAGFAAVGMDVTVLGPLPTPAVAGLTRSLRADLGVMISASHNPFEDNGIKLFGPDGFKLSDEIEARIEAEVVSDGTPGRAAPQEIGKAQRLDGAGERYIEMVKASFPRGLRLNDLRVVVDCAHGAAYKVAPKILWELGAEVIEIGNQPNGYNINEACGSTHPESAAEAVRRYRADLGIALDGDADRLILLDERGQVVDGDQVLALIAADWLQRGRLTGDGVVATLMSNLGLERYLNDLGLTLHRTKVGDRYVVERMRGSKLNLGGEQSGHIVMTDFATTGDGLVAALQVLAVLLAQNRPMSQLARTFTPVPQKLRNIRYRNTPPLEHKAVQQAISGAETRLKGHGRLLVRKSGTEPVVRVMVEADEIELLDKVLSEVADAMQAHAG